ncbi:hypothetical protein [Aeromonas veronii]|uniref:hypothetical protein n=1 Tax=Aeromonas veronii TaxID=654 RepID=UPI002415D747|nr:hypothetical protein [Aeromonas veronii]WFO49765.1 hypothetical protein L1O00_12025 [Aeromonas veronii]
MKTSLEIEELNTFFKKNVFSTGSSYGFLDVNLTKLQLSATYVEKESTIQEFVDPLGEVYEQTLITYHKFGFTVEPLTNGVLLLAVTNPPRTIKNFIDKISSGFNYLVTFSSVNLSINKLITTMDRNKSISLIRVKRIKVSGVKLNDNSIACIEVASQNNAMDDLDDYVANTNYTIDKVSGNMFINESNMTFEITKTGLVNISNDECPLGFLFDAIQH